MMTTRKRFREFAKRLTEEKQYELDELEREYSAKRAKIEEEYDLNKILEDDCSQCLDEMYSWSCSHCSHKLCKTCICDMRAEREANADSFLETIQQNNLDTARREYVQQGMVCPNCKLKRIL